MRVFVSRPLPAPAMERLSRRFEIATGPADRATTAEELLAGARDADALVSMLSDRVDAGFLAACPRLRVVANYAVGVNNIDLAAAASRGVWATNTPGVLTDATADLAFGLLLAAARRIPESERFLRAGRFDGWAPLLYLGADVTGARLGIVGLGRIGQAMARRARGFGMEVVYNARAPRPADEEQGARFVELDELLGTSDFVSLHCPLTPQTHHLLDAKALARMKRGAILVNTARGPVVDEAALVEALRSGHLAGAGLDVFEEEPAVHPGLLALDNVVLTPHTGSATHGTRLRMAMMVCEDVERVLGGEAPLRPVNRPVSG